MLIDHQVISLLSKMSQLSIPEGHLWHEATGDHLVLFQFWVIGGMALLVGYLKNRSVFSI